MKNLKKHLLKILSITSISSLPILAVSCKTLETKSENREHKPNSGDTKQPDQPSNNNHIKPNHSNKTDPDHNQNNTSENNKNDVIQKPNNKNEESENVTPVDENVTPVQPSSQHIDPDTPTISNVDLNISDQRLDFINQTYLRKTVEDFVQNPVSNLSEQDLQAMMLNNNVVVNFYAHSDFEIDQKIVELDQFDNNKVQLKLINKKENKPVSNSEIRWYQRTITPYDLVLKANQNDKDKATFDLKDDGWVHWKDNKRDDVWITPEQTSAWIYAEYKGYLFPAIVKVYSRDQSDLMNKEKLALKEAKKIVQENNWKSLPFLERIVESYKWMFTNVTYKDEKELHKHLPNENAYSALVLKASVCAGYSKGYKMLLDELGIPSRFAIREISHVKHVWNLIEVDNKWYHADTTSDAYLTSTKRDNFYYFLNNDDDILPRDNYTQPNFKGERLRNLKIKNFVSSKDDVLALIDKSFDEKTKLVKPISVVVNKNNYKMINDAFDERKLLVKNWKRSGRFYGGVNLEEITYYFIDKPSSDIENVKITNIAKHTENSIKVDFDKEVENLKKGNFEIENALIKNTEKQGTSYILHLDHFNKIGDVEIKLKSVNKQNYKFDITKNEPITFKTSIVDFDAKINAIDDNSIKVETNQDNLEYSFNNNEWKELGQDKLIKDAVIGVLRIRVKNNSGLVTSEMKIFNITRDSINHNQIKLFKNTVIGVDNTMEYKEVNSDKWTSIDKNKLTLNQKGDYLIRIKSVKNNIASDVYKVTIS